MRLDASGKNISLEVTNISAHGLWLWVDGEEHFLDYQRFPWFKDATVAQLSRVEAASPHHLHWPDLDVDLTLDSIRHPERYPLVSRARPSPGGPK